MPQRPLPSDNLIGTILPRLWEGIFLSGFRVENTKKEGEKAQSSRERRDYRDIIRVHRISSVV